MISILCPTRNREKILQRMIDSALKKTSGKLEILLYFDNDDPLRLKEWYPAISISGKSEGVGKAWNTLAKRARGDLLMMGNDDLVFQTKDWDLILKQRIKKYADEIFVAWCNDGLYKKCTFPIVSRKWYECLGYFAPECFGFFYHDTWLYKLGKNIDRTIYFPEILIEHMHHAVKKSRKDRTYKQNDKFGDEDIKKFANTKDIRKRDAEKLRTFISDFQARNNAN